VRNGRHHIVVLVITWALLLVLAAYGAFEKQRMALAEERQLRHSLERGLELYARNCSTCHGPMGEGCIGKPLNPLYREDFQGGPEKNRRAAEIIRQAIAEGRPGMSTPTWVTLEDGSMASYTAMPAWSKAKGGPLNDMHIQDLVNFIMLGDFNKVLGKVQEMDAELRKALEESAAAEGKTYEEVAPLRDAPGLTAEQNRRGQEIFVKRGCTLCHRIGSRGGSAGPDLSYVGSWGVSREFLKEWIRNPQRKQHRMPEFWLDAALGPTVDASPEKRVAIPPTVMPPLVQDEQELEDLVTYLMGLTLEPAR